MYFSCLLFFWPTNLLIYVQGIIGIVITYNTASLDRCSLWQRGFSLIEGEMLWLEKAAFEKGAVTVCDPLCVFCVVWTSVPVVMLILTRHNTAQPVHRTRLCPPPSPGKQTPRDAGTGHLLCFLSLDQYLPCHLYKLQT